MKKYATILLLLLSINIAFSQKKEKVKGSKLVTTQLREVGNFSALEVEDNLDIYLEKGEVPEIRIEADDNLHNIITIDLKEKTLRIYTSKEATRFKKLSVRVIYTGELKFVIAKNESTVNAIQEIQVDDITFKSIDYSKLFLNVNSKNFSLQADDKSEIELNLKSENAKIELSKNASLKSLLSTTDLTCDLYQKAEADLEGKTKNAVIRLDNNSNLTATKLTIKNADLTTESYTECSINADSNIIIDATDKSEIQLYGSPKIEIRNFAKEAKLLKKER